MVEIAVFYCQHQTARIRELLEPGIDSVPMHIRKSALPCSGKLEVSFLLKALEDGADGVALFGCPEEECRYMVGSERARNRVRLTGKILNEIGLGEERVRRFVCAPHSGETDREQLRGWVMKIQAMGKWAHQKENSG